MSKPKVQIQNTTSIEEVFSKPYTKIVIGNIRSSKPFVYDEELPPNYSVQIINFGEDGTGKPNIRIQLTTRTPFGYKNMIDVRLAKPTIKNFLIALRRFTEILQLVMKTFDNQIPTLRERKEVPRFEDIFKSKTSKRGGKK